MLALLAASGVLLAGCQKEEGNKAPEQLPVEEQEEALPSEQLEGEVLVWSMGSQPESCDPAQYTTAAEASVLNNVMEGLFRVSKGEAQPALAQEAGERAENQDGTVTYTYRLRAAQWSDGEAVKAGDFVYAWQRAAAQEENPYRYLFAMIATTEPEGDEEPKLLLEAQGDDVLQVTLQGDVPYFDQLLALPAFFPLREDVPADALSRGALFNGPFTVGEMTKGEELILEKNKNYRGAQDVALDYVVGKVLTGESGQWDGKKVELGVPTAENWSRASHVEFCSTQYLLLSKTPETKALEDPKVRRALSLALDRTALADETVGSVTPALGLVPPCAGGTGGFLKVQANLEEAKALLEEAGVAVEETELQLLVPKGQETPKAVAEAVQVMWQELGVSVTIVEEGPEAYQNLLVSGTFPGAVLTGWYGDANDPAEFLNPFLSVSQGPFHGYGSIAYNKAVFEAFPKTGEERLEAMANAEKILLEDGYVIPLYHDTVAVAGGEKAQNWEVDNRGVYWFGQASLGE